MDDGGTPRRKPWLGVVLVIAIAWALSQWWSSSVQADVGRQIAEHAQPGDLLMISSTTCAICVEARGWLQRHRVRFDECAIELDAACAARFAATLAPGTPVFVVRGAPQVGFSPQRLAEALKRD
jgi:hypothetical protein